MKKGIVVLLALMLMTVSAMAETSIVEKIHYEGRGFIEVEFVRDVRYQDSTVTLKGQDGVEYPATIVEQDEDDLTFYIKDLPGGVTYDVTLSGILDRRSGEAVTATAQIALPEEGVPAIQTVEYDWKDEELDIDFFERVDYRELKVELTDQSGAVYDVRVLESDSDSLEVRAEGLDYGATYTITVSGVSLYGEDDYRSVSMEFEAVDR